MSSSQAEMGIVERIKEGWDVFKKDYMAFGLMVFIGNLVAGGTAGILGAPISIGFFNAEKKQRAGEKVQIGDAFSGMGKFGPSFLYMIFLSLMTAVIPLALFILRLILVLLFRAIKIFALARLFGVLFVILIILSLTALILLSITLAPIGIKQVSEEEDAQPFELVKRNLTWVKDNPMRALHFLGCMALGSLLVAIPLVGGIIASSINIMSTSTFYQEEKAAGRL